MSLACCAGCWLSICWHQVHLPRAGAAAPRSIETEIDVGACEAAVVLWGFNHSPSPRRTYVRQTLPRYMCLYLMSLFGNASWTND